MKKKKVYIIIILCFLHSNITFSQGPIPVKKYLNDYDYNFSNLKFELDKRKTFSIAYRLNSFTNYNYASNLQSGDLNYKGGIEIVVKRYMWTPLILDYGGFYETYDYSNNNITHYGGKVAVSTFLFPAPKFILPYGGIGLQLSSLSAKLYSKNNGYNVDETSNTSCLFWKVGLQSIIGDFFSIHFEYNQSILPVNKSQNHIILGVGLHL